MDNTFFEKVACGLLICKNDAGSTIIEANDAFYELVGYTKEEMETIFQNRFASMVIDDLDEILIKVNNAVANKSVLDYEYRLRHKKGHTIWIHDIANYDATADVFYVVIMDISYKMRVIDQLRRVSMVDKLTYVLNRNGIEKRVGETLGEWPKESYYTMFLLDLDDFKLLNDNCGHPVGDRALQGVGQRLLQLFREEDVVGRLGGDEFVVFIKGFQSVEEIEKRAEQIIKNLSFDIELCKVSVTVGVAYTRYRERLTFKAFYKEADEALYMAKRKGKGHYMALEMLCNEDETEKLKKREKTRRK